MDNDQTYMRGPADSCPPPQQLRHWLDGKNELSDEQTLHVRKCEECLQSLDRLTNGDELRFGGVALPASPQKLPFASEDALAALQRDLVTPPNTPASRFDTLDETPSQIDTGGSIPPGGEGLDASWLARQFDPQRYFCEGLIGQGGNANVYRLYDNLLDRQFAVKMISSDSQRGRQRMLREAKLLADIDHPNIVRVFDAGQVSEGAGANAIFIAMEFMAGGTLGGVNAGVVPASSRDFCEIAELLACVCDGLGFAHEKGIVHRDLKPANILLDLDRKIAKIADFGLASRDSDPGSLLTRTGAILGTPAFMSPEQATGSDSVDALSDIYSLGATLYCLLAGQVPFVGNPAAVARQIVDADPTSPSVLNQAAPRSIVAICERAMEKEPSRRYATAAEFASDLRAFASGAAVSAKPISTFGKLQRQLRRDRKLYHALQAVVLLAAAVLILAVGSAVVYRFQSNRLAESADRERESKELLQKTLARSIEAADQLLVSVTEDLSLLPSSPGTDRISAALLDRAKRYYLQFLQDNADNSELKFQLARAHAGLARIAFRSGDAALGASESQDALRMLAAYQPDENDRSAEYQSQQYRADVLLVLGASVGKASPADPKADEALVGCIRLCKQIDPSSLGETDRAKLLGTQISALRNRSVMLGRIGRDDEAGTLAQEAAGLGAELVSKAEVAGKSLRVAAMASQTLGIHRMQHQDFAGGAQEIEQALLILDRIQESEATALRIHDVRANLHTNLARIAMMRGELEEATQQQSISIEIHKQLLATEPDVPSHKMDLVDAIMNSTNILYAQENYSQVVDESRAAIEILDELIAANDQNPDYRQTKAMLQGNMAIVLLHQGEALLSIQPLTESIGELQRVAEQLQHAPAAEVAVALNHYSLSGAYYDLEKYEEALESLDTSDAITQRVLQASPDFSPATDHMVDSLFRRTDVLLAMGAESDDEVLAAARQALEFSDTLLAGASDVLDYKSRHLLLITTRGGAHLGLGDWETAVSDAHAVLQAVAEHPSDTRESDFADALLYAHLLEHDALVKGLESEEPDSSLVAELEARIAASRAAAEKFGAHPDDFGSLNR